MSGYWRAAAAIWGKSNFMFKEHASPFPGCFSNIKSKYYVFFSQKLECRDNLHNKVSPLDWKGKFNEHNKCVFCTKRGLKVSTKMNAITTQGFSPCHNLAAAQFRAKLPSQGVMRQQGGVLLDPAGQGSAGELTPKMPHQGRDLPNLNCSPATSAEICSSGSTLHSAS